MRGDLKIIKIGVRPLEWLDPKVSGKAPLARMNATLTFQESLNILLLFGGQNTKTGRIFNDIFLLDLDSFCWHEVIMYDEMPIERHCHSTIIFDNMLIVFGGMGNNKFIGSDLYLINMGKDHS